MLLLRVVLDVCRCVSLRVAVCRFVSLFITYQADENGVDLATCIHKAPRENPRQEHANDVDLRSDE